MLTRSTIILLVVGMSCLAQTPVPTSFSFPVPVSFIAQHHNFDMVANELGMHIVYDSSQSIVHSLVGANGRLLGRSVVISGISGFVRPSVSSHVRNNVEEMHIAFRDGNDIKLRRSTDGGMTWLTPQNQTRFAETSAATNRLQMTADEDYVHVTWDTESAIFH